MTETPTDGGGPTTPGPGGRIEPVELQTSMQRAYIDYAMAVIVGRALPDVRDGLKPVHRRVLYAMYDGGYRPDRGFSKCSRVVGDVMGQYHPHGDTAIYDTLVRLAQPWVMRAPMIQGQGNFGSPGNDAAAAMRYTECRMAPLALEMVRDIDEETVDFQPNYDGRSQEPVVLPSRIPNLLVNGSAGIAVGMATNIPPHNLREVAEGARWALDHPDASREELQDALIERIKGPDFPNGALIVGHQGIEQAYRTGRGSITQRAVIEVDEDQRGRTCLVITELPYMVNPDNLALKIAELADSGRVQGIADVRDDTSDRTGQRLVVVLKRDAVARVVLNNLLKHTELQTNFSANMLALVDGVPRTLSIDQFISNWVEHQVEVIRRRTEYRLRKAEERAHILRGLVKALDMLDEVIALIRRSPEVDDARQGLIELLAIDELQADAILNMQLRRLAALERQKIIDELAEIERTIADLSDILANVTRQRQIVSDELAEIVEKYGDERRTQIIAADGDLSMEDLIPDEDLVVSITRGGYAKRTRADQYRTQKRGGKGVRGASLRGDDVVEHFIATTNHHWLLFFTTAGRVYRTKAYNLPEASRDAKGGHVAGLLSFQPDESIAQVLAIRDYEQAPYLVLATRNGLVKKTRLGDYNSPRQAGVIAINFREDDDELIGAELVNAEDDILLVSRKGQAIRFRADDAQLRPMGRATSGVSGMKFREGDSLLSLSVIRAAQVAAEEAAGLSEQAEDSAAVEATAEQVEEVKPQYVFTITDGGFAKRTRINEYRLQSRGGLGIKAMSLANEERGGLVGAFIVEDGDEILSITEKGQVVRSPINDQFRPTGRSTMGVKFVTPKSGDAVAVVARSGEARVEEEVAEAADAAAQEVVEAVTEDPAVEAAAVETADLAQDVESAETADSGPGATIEPTDATDEGEGED
ncbi:DNA gyrase subunit A [Nocardioides deserti]|uniref:DNA gyrase subunit A n=2 Tax=Nocardioides deserti TaxID=1588644 RepID=A0ABR6U539_9ACTN|nr:DNA gyrase subunit A [Nocardioides deserti]MBC2959510.1 DNA gyrase subunit A [Nocardioides deserti]GGO73744.1 DNA gyrase subunit A [Nocardioides deserti]